MLKKTSLFLLLILSSVLQSSDIETRDQAEKAYNILQDRAHAVLQELYFLKDNNKLLKEKLHNNDMRNLQDNLLEKKDEMHWLLYGDFLTQVEIWYFQTALDAYEKSIESLSKVILIHSPYSSSRKRLRSE